jgi:butyryl-CoA dehydrogenase
MDNLFYNETELMLSKTVQDFAQDYLVPMAPILDEREEFPMENFHRLASMGLLGITIDEKYGGAGGGFKEFSIVTEEIAKACGATSAIYGSHIGLVLQTIAKFGNEEQKSKFLPRLIDGTSIGAWGLTEPDSGSDVASMSTTCTPGDGIYRLNGTKHFITNGDVADTFVIFATQNRELKTKGVNCLVVDRDSPGFQTIKQDGKLGMKASTTAELVFEDCSVPEENRLGEENTGFYAAMQILESSRIAIAAQSVGIGQACLEAATKHAITRKTFNNPIASYQAIQWMLADMATEIDAARLLTRRASILKDMNEPHNKEASMAKLFASEAANRAATKAVQILGGYGYFKSSHVERYFRDAKITEIYEGTSEIHRLIISRSIINSASTN